MKSPITNIVIPILFALIPAILAQADKITLEIALLIDAPILVIYLGWIFSPRKKSIIDWDRFRNVIVRSRWELDYGEYLIKGKNYKKNLAAVDYNNYITYLYLIALYEEKENFAKELWDKARVSDTFDERKQTEI